MRADVLAILDSNKEWKDYVRQNPHWYRTLVREPEEVHKLEYITLHHYEKTIPHKVEKFSSNVQMAQMMLNMLSTMKKGSD